MRPAPRSHASMAGDHCSDHYGQRPAPRPHAGWRSLRPAPMPHAGMLVITAAITAASAKVLRRHGWRAPLRHGWRALQRPLRPASRSHAGWRSLHRSLRPAPRPHAGMAGDHGSEHYGQPHRPEASFQADPAAQGRTQHWKLAEPQLMK